MRGGGGSEGPQNPKGTDSGFEGTSNRYKGADSGFEGLRKLRDLVYAGTACDIPGCTIKFDIFIPVLRRAVSRGFVRPDHAAFVEAGLRYGFTLGVPKGAITSLKWRKRVFKNYTSAYNARAAVTASIGERITAGRTLVLGAWEDVKPQLDIDYDAYFVFPLGAVPKPNQPAINPDMRPFSDHTKTGFNALMIIMGILQHSLDVYNQVAYLLKQNYFMYVSDVADAFMLIPLAPWLWPFFLFRWFVAEEDVRETTLVHVMADFGSRAMPGTFKIFLVDCVVQMARSELIITLPMTVYVDDSAILGPDAPETNREMRAFQFWSTEICGVPWKQVKDRVAARPQYYIGFWWHSATFTRTLDERKLHAYLDVLATAAEARTLTLQDRRSVAGKMQRAIMTFPPGAACLLVNCYLLMSGLTLPWQTRRTTKAERSDYEFVHHLLKLNLGRGYYSYDGFAPGPEYLSDASKSREYTGGGYVGSDGFADHFVYGTSAARKPIDFIEGDVVVRACMERGETWRGMLIPFGIDNSAFQASAAKGRSRAPRLNYHLRKLFSEQILKGYILQPYWLSSEDNYLADHLSRGRVQAFLEALPGSGFLRVSVYDCRFHPDAGRKVVLDDDSDGGGMRALRQLTDAYSSNTMKDGPARGVGVGGDAQLLSVTYPAGSIFDGLPPEYEDRLDQIMDNRLAVSSRSKMLSGYGRWQRFCEEHGWEPLLPHGFAQRGGRIAAWIVSLVDDTKLVFGSIATYLWGMRTFHVLQHQPDPVFGVMHWREFMGGVAVLTAVAGEPREMVPLQVLTDVLELLWKRDDFASTQLGLILLILLFTFSRTECPCPKTWNGLQDFDKKQHWTVRDFRMELVHLSGSWVLWIRFKGIKQDKRIERPSAKGGDEWVPDFDVHDGAGRDWVPVGDVSDRPLFSVRAWYVRFIRQLAKERGPDEPMFRARDKERPYTYGCLMADFREVLAAVGADTKLGPHGLRVLGYNLSKLGNGVDLTVAHGGWLSSGHSRYERFSQREVLGVPAGMLGIASEHGPPDEPRAINRTRAVRGIEAQLVPDDFAGEPGEAAAEPAVNGALPEDYRDPLLEGVVETKHTTRLGREYSTFRYKGVTYRSKAALWRAVGANIHSDELHHPPTPVPSFPSSSMEREISSVPPASSKRRIRSPEPSYVEFDPTGRCGNPACVVPATSSRAPYHVGLCVFDLVPRRRRASRSTAFGGAHLGPVT